MRHLKLAPISAVAIAALLCSACADDGVVDTKSSDGAPSTSTAGGATTSGGATDASGPSSTSGAGETSETSETAGLPQACECVTPSERPVSCEDARTVQCALEPLCDPIVYECPRPNQDMYACDAEYEFDEDALTCALVALRDRAPGIITASGENDICGFEGCGDDRVELAITSDERVVSLRCSSSPISLESVSTSEDELAPPQHFESCLELAGGPARYSCLLDGLTGSEPICNDP